MMIYMYRCKILEGRGDPLVKRDDIEYNVFDFQHIMRDVSCLLPPRTTPSILQAIYESYDPENPDVKWAAVVGQKPPLGLEV